MNGFNSKVVCKNLSVTIWEILFNITIPIIHHKYRGGLVITRGGFVKRPLSLWYAPQGVPGGGGVNENVSPVLKTEITKDIKIRRKHHSKETKTILYIIFVDPVCLF